LANLAAATRSANPNNKDIVTLDIINPETDNKHKTPNQNQKYLNSKPTKILRTQRIQRLTQKIPNSLSKNKTG